MVPGSAADLRRHLFPSSWQEHYKLVTVGFAALQGCDEKKARKTSVFGDHYLSQSDTPPRAALKKAPARHELLRIKRSQFSISFGKLGPKCIILGYQDNCGRCNSFHPTCEVKTRGVLVNDQLLMLATNTEAKKSQISTDAVQVAPAFSNLSGPPHHLLFPILRPPRLEAGEHGGDHHHHHRHDHEDGGVGRGGGQDGRAAGGEEEQEQEP